MDIWHHIAGCDFVWNQDKALSNLQKHGVRFEDAATVFLDPLMVLTDASRNDEARDAAIGFDLQARLLFVVHIEFESTADGLGAAIRIISARPAEALEENFYAQ